MAHQHTRSTRLIGLMAAGLAVALQMTPLSAGAATSVATSAAQTPTQAQMANVPIYGSQLMSDQERTEFRARMWAAQSNEERERIRAEHHVEMQKRAQERGVTLPEMPPAGMGRGGRGGPGMGSGMGSGMSSGMGPGACAASAAGCPLQKPRARGTRHPRGAMMNR